MSPKKQSDNIVQLAALLRSVMLVRRILPAMGIILMKIKDQAKSRSWDWALDTIACHFKTISYPENSGWDVTGDFFFFFWQRLQSELSRVYMCTLYNISDSTKRRFVDPIVMQSMLNLLFFRTKNASF